jgi:L-lactate dehydrogenase complex protein LldF
MGNTAEEFLVASEQKSFEMDHRRIINKSIDKYDTAFDRGISRMINVDNTKKKGHAIKWKVMENLDKFLPEFESNFQKRGGKVIWANDAEEANREILNIITKAGAKTVIKSKSMATEEIHLNSLPGETRYRIAGKRPRRIHCSTAGAGALPHGNAGHAPIYRGYCQTV